MYFAAKEPILSPETLARFRRPGPCAGCKVWCPVRVPHHIIPRGLGGGNQLDHPFNLLSVGWWCPCHRLMQEGKISQEEQWALVAERECVSVRRVLEVIRGLCRRVE